MILNEMNSYNFIYPIVENILDDLDIDYTRYTLDNIVRKVSEESEDDIYNVIESTLKEQSLLKNKYGIDS